MKPFGIIALISGNGSNLQAIINAVRSGQINGTIQAVVSDKPDAFGLTRAKQANIPTEIVQKRPSECREVYDQRLLGVIDAYQPDLIVLAGFMRILSAPFVNHYAAKIINIHPSLLPKYPGLNTHQAVLDNSDKTHGVTIHYVIPALDAGPIICQDRLEVQDGETIEQLKARIHQLEHKAYPDVIAHFSRSEIALEDDTVFLNEEKLPKTGYEIGKI